MIISNAYGSGIQIRGNWIRFQKPGTQTDMIVAKPDNEVELYYNGSQKLETTNTGVTVTGSLTSETHISTIATGTAPLTVASTTMVSNLNADKLDDKEFTDIIAEATALAIALG